MVTLLSAYIVGPTVFVHLTPALCQVLAIGSSDSRSKSHRIISSFKEKKNFVLKWTPKINDMQVYGFSNCNRGILNIFAWFSVA